MNPYNRLLGEIKDWCKEIKVRHKANMWRYPKEKLDGNWSLADLYQRTQAAEQLGYDVQLEAKEDGLFVVYVKKIEIPWKWE